MLQTIAALLDDTDGRREYAQATIAGAAENKRNPSYSAGLGDTTTTTTSTSTNTTTSTVLYASRKPTWRQRQRWPRKPMETPP